MSILTIPGTAGENVDLHYVDLGQGRPVVLIHGWPLSHKSWEYQLAELPKHGLRVIAYDRRGFGESSKPWSGYDYDTLADDLHALLEHLDVKDAVLVGFSMGGGEVARYIGRHGQSRVGAVVLMSAVTPYLLKTADNASGVDKSVFDGMVEGLQGDRPGFLEGFGKKFFGVGLLSHPVSAATLQWAQGLALPASPKATVDCVRAFSETDFRADLAKITVPTLIIHGTDDQTVPPAASGDQAAKALPSAEYKRYDGAPHGVFITHKDQLNADLIAFSQTR
ncbi:alpha/beta fold hydrolase [Sphingomonas sp. NCPPB 2930]